MQKNTMNWKIFLILLPIVFLLGACEDGGDDFPDGDNSPLTAVVVINEIQARSALGADWVELYNAGGSEIALEGWQILDNQDREAYTLPSGTILAAGGYLIISQDDAGQTGFSYGLGREDSVRLYDADTALVDSCSWLDGEAPEDESWGRIPNGEGDFKTLGISTPGAANIDSPSSDGDESEYGQLLFDEEHLAKITLDIAQSNVDILLEDQATGRDPSYVPAEFSFDSSQAIEVGVRVKGHFTLSASDGVNLPFVVDFNRYDSNLEFDGTTKMHMHNNVIDSTQLKDYLSYGAWRAYGVPAPRTGWAEVSINGKKIGLYTLVEYVGGRFLERHYEFSEGDLYKPEPPAGSLEYRGSNIEAYENIDHVRVDGSDHASFLNFVNVLNKGTLKQLSSVMDIEGILTYFAVNIGIGNYDSYIGEGHNYSLYESSAGSFTFLPWDMNLSQSLATEPCGPGTNPGTDGMDFVLSERLLGNADHLQNYLDIMKAFLEGPGSIQSLNARIDAAEALLGNRLDADSTAELKSNIKARVNGLLDKLDGVESCPKGF